MASWRKLLLESTFFWFVICCVYSEDIPSNANGDLPSSSHQSSDKRPSTGHSFVRFGRGEEANKGHSFLYFGKRTIPQESNIAELLQYLQRTQEPSWKRGHSIMRFGKRTSDNKHSMLRFGKRDEEEEEFDESTPENLKRGGHSMMYFGKRGPSDEEDEKRGGHSMMYFGKRGGHSMMYFGKRDPDGDEEKRRGHSMMYFGKREPDDYEKRAGHSMLYFGKREPDDDEKRAGHSMMYFGKRGGHSMMYFGKRDSDEDSQEDASGAKRSPHSMIHFGKKADNQKTHSMLRFGKRSEDMTDEEFADDMEKKAGHNMIHFGKREAGIMGKSYPIWMPGSGSFESMPGSFYGLGMGTPKIGPKLSKKPHNMMHFGKRSVDETVKANEGHEDKADSAKELPEKPVILSRKKRDLLSSEAPLIGFSPYVPSYSAMYDYIDDNESPESYDDSKILADRKTRSDGEQGKSKNVFLRFG